MRSLLAVGMALLTCQACGGEEVVLSQTPPEASVGGASATDAAAGAGGGSATGGSGRDASSDGRAGGGGASSGGAAGTESGAGDAQDEDVSTADAPTDTGGAFDAGAGCPATAPAQDDPCTSPGQLCCYGYEPVKPWRCVPTQLDGGGPYAWVTLQSRMCCPTSAPTIDQVCTAPGDLVCCYGAVGFSCNQQPSPDVWASATCP